MREKFVAGFVTSLHEEIPDKYLELIRNKLAVYVNEFDITPRETAIVKYTGYLPEFYKTYLVSRKIEGLSMKTLKLYDLYLNDFFFTVNKDAKEITANDIRVYLYNAQQARNLSNRTLDSRRTAIHVFFAWASGEGYIDKNPCGTIKNIKYERIQKTPLTDIELERVRQACKTPREKALIEFLYSTGARVTEACTVKISDLDFAKSEVIVLGKGNKHRKTYLNARSKILLNQYLNIRDDTSEYLFVGSRKPHAPLKKAAVEKILRGIGEEAGMDRPLTPHLFRHTLATLLLQRGTPITEVQKILGHANINTTMIYAKVAENDVKTSHMKYAI